jgi:2-polyprenyl-3-methyl-5-hydroxy-6-metoxy-1,4-benzoquinol methylase
MHTPVSPCPVCEGKTVETASRSDRRGAPLLTVACTGCGHVYNDPVPGAAELAAFYARDYRLAYKGAQRPRGRQIVRNFARVESFWRRWGHVLARQGLGRRARVLDVGAGSGEFLYVAQALGHDARGVEPNEAYARYCREALNLDVATAGLESLEAGALYDVIRLNHVLEHLRDPVEALARISQSLAPDGVLHVEVPDLLAYARLKSRGGMFHYGHISNFTPWTLRAAAARAGLRETQESAAALGDHTSGFFQRATPADAREALNAHNAARVRAAIAAHYADAPRGTQPLARTLSRLRLRAQETLLAIRLGSPAAAGDYFVRRLRRESGESPNEPPRALTPSRI